MVQLKKNKKITRIVLLLGVASGIHAANPVSKVFTIGQYYNGGVIFWIDPARKNQHGLIADINDQPDHLLTWANAAPCATTFESITGDGAYIGASNTAQIIQVCTAENAPAAAACYNSTAQGYTDWYLPSELELAQMLINQMSINQTAQVNGGSAFGSINGNSTYWSSTEDNADNAFGFYGYRYFMYPATKTTSLSVRCVRAF